MKLTKYRVHTGASRYDNQHMERHFKVFSHLQKWGNNYESIIDEMDGSLRFDSVDLKPNQANYLRQLGAEVVPRD